MSRFGLKRLVAGVGVAMVALGGTLAWVYADPPSGKAPEPTPPAKDSASDYANRWVAVMFNNVPITREEFGEYLIARHSQDLELLVNKKIVEYGCKEKGVEVTDAEVKAAIGDDLKSLGGITLDQFVKNVLAPRHKTLLEWTEDVVRPKLALTKLCKDNVHLTEQDFRDAFDAHYGEKIECRLILFPPGEEKTAMNKYAELRTEEGFANMARHQASPSLASTGGKIRPISRHSTGNDELEKEAFSLQPGDLSKLVGTPEGTAVLKCDRRLPPDATKKLETERANLEKEIFEKKLQVEIPNYFNSLKKRAEARLFLRKVTTEEDLKRDVERELHQGGLSPTTRVPAAKPPQAN